MFLSFKIFLRESYLVSLFLIALYIHSAFKGCCIFNGRLFFFLKEVLPISLNLLQLKFDGLQTIHNPFLVMKYCQDFSSISWKVYGNVV